MLIRVNNWILKANSIDEAINIAKNKRIIGKNESIESQSIGEIELELLSKKHKFIRMFKGGRCRIYNPTILNLFDNFIFCEIEEKVDFISIERI